MIEFLGIGAAVLIAMYVHSLWIHWRTGHLEKHAAAMEEFYAASNALLSDRDTPAVILHLLRFMNIKASRPQSAREFLVVIIRKPNFIGRNVHVVAMEKFARERPELGLQLAKACTTALEAMAYRSPVAGIFLRVFVIFDGREHAERTMELAENYCALEEEVKHPELELA